MLYALLDSLTMLRDTRFTYGTHISDCLWLAFAKLTEACKRAPCVWGRGQGGELGYVVHPQDNAFSVQMAFTLLLLCSIDRELLIDRS